MGYGVMPYAVDLDGIRNMIGSKSPETLRRCLNGFSGRATSINSLIEDHFSDQKAAHRPTARDVLRHLIFGEAQDERIGFAYAYCLEHLCEVQGRSLDNRGWYPIPTTFINDVQEELTRAGVSAAVFSLNTLIWGQSPIALPPIRDFPGIGFLPKSRILLAWQALSTVELPAISDESIQFAVEGLLDWVSACRDQNQDLVCFYH